MNSRKWRLRIIVLHQSLANSFHRFKPGRLALSTPIFRAPIGIMQAPLRDDRLDIHLCHARPI